MSEQNRADALARWIVRNMPECPFGEAPGTDTVHCRGFKEENCPECVRENALRLMAPDAASAMAEWIGAHAACCPFPTDGDKELGESCVGFGEAGCSKCILDHAGMLGRPSDKLGNDLSRLKPGDYILYQNGARFELGRVKRVDFEARKAFVWYSSGDTASRTAFSDLILLENARDIKKTALGGADAEEMFV